MQTLQIRLPDEILKKVDELVQQGFYSSRSDFLKEATRRYIMEFNYAGCLPYIVGPFSKEQMELLKKNSEENLFSDDDAIEDTKNLLKSLQI